jgi:hypothetical protein
MKSVCRYPAFFLAIVIVAAGLDSCKGKAQPGSSKQQPGIEASAGTGTGTSAESEKAQPREAEANAATLPIGQPTPRVVPEKTVPALYRKASTAFKKGDDEAVRESLDQAIKLDPYYDSALLLRARQYAKDGQKQEALSMLERLVALNFRKFEPMIARTGWLKDIRQDQALWIPFKDKVEAYRKQWDEALEGPGVIFLEGHFQKLEGSDLSGQPLDLRFARGIPMFWSKKVRRFLFLGDRHDVSGFIHDRERGKLYLVHWQPHPQATPGIMGRVLVSRMDLTGSEPDSKPIVLAEEAEAVRAALDGEGNLLVEVVAPEGGPAAAPPAVKPAVQEGAGEGGEEAGEEETAGDEAEAESEAEAAAAAPEEEAGKKAASKAAVPAATGKEGKTVSMVKKVDWKSGKLADGEAAEDQEWPLVITLGATSGPAPRSVPDVKIAPPKAKRGGACTWIDASSAVCFEPTKKEGRWHYVTLKEEGAEPVNLVEQKIPIVQY